MSAKYVNILPPDYNLLKILRQHFFIFHATSVDLVVSPGGKIKKSGVQGLKEY
jgi:hypothetical protein